MPTYAPSWRAPLYPWLQIVGIVCYGFLLVALGALPLAIAAVILGVGVAWYFLHAKMDVLRESALIRVAGRLAAADFEGHDLEAELSRVAREHNVVMEDRFDRLIQDCPVLDVQDETTRDELLRLAARNLAERLPLSAEELGAMLTRREALSSTVVRPGLAIPHLIIAGDVPFQVLMIRCKRGAAFAEDQVPVRAAFVLAASTEDRNFYLKALVAIAEIAQDEEFDRKWLAAGTPEALREVVLSAERRRDHETD